MPLVRCPASEYNVGAFTLTCESDRMKSKRSLRLQEGHSKSITAKGPR